MPKKPVYLITSYNVDRDYPMYNVLSEDTYNWILTGQNPSEDTMKAAFHSSDFYTDFKKATKVKTYGNDFRTYFAQETQNYTYDQRLQTFEVSDITFEEAELWDAVEINEFMEAHNLEIKENIDFYER